MNWSRLFLQKEQFGTSAYKKVEWTAKFVEVSGGRLDSGFAEGGKATMLGNGRCELETQGAFAPEARGELRVSMREVDFWSEFSNDRVAFGTGEDDSVRVHLDEPAIVVEGKPVVTMEKSRGKAGYVLLGATKGDRFLGYVPASLKSAGVMSFLFGTSALTPWFIPAREPWGGKKLIESSKAPPEMGKALADADAWKALEESAGDLMEALLAARILFAAMQFVRYG
ncbi:MAG: hypothetical protein FD180_3002 [Planctomycetota bacterium]|nr:MAG: hypothetical protein FD180_3002 [Planctomycetota bacterium]